MSYDLGDPKHPDFGKAAHVHKLEPLPEGYAGDTGIQMIFDTLTDRGHDPAELKAQMDAYEGDFWNDFFGPLLDRIEAIITDGPIMDLTG